MFRGIVDRPTPGHTPACMTHIVGDAAFVGDTLFMPDGGSARADFPGGDARTLYRSIRRVLASPGQTRASVSLRLAVPPDQALTILLLPSLEEAKLTLRCRAGAR